MTWRTPPCESPRSPVEACRNTDITIHTKPEKIISNSYYFVGLFACSSQPTRQTHVLRISEHPAEGIAGKRARRSLVPGQDHPAVQPTGQRHPKELVAPNVSSQASIRCRGIVVTKATIPGTGSSPRKTLSCFDTCGCTKSF
jgi:hypothetical protein